MKQRKVEKLDISKLRKKKPVIEVNFREEGEFIRYWEKVQEYADSIENSERFQKMLKRGRRIWSYQVRTPDGIPARYVINVTKDRKRDYDFEKICFIEMEDIGGKMYGTVGRSELWEEEKARLPEEIKEEAGRERKVMIMIHRHAIERYIERHGYEGGYEECVDYLLSNTSKMQIFVDTNDCTFKGYFEDGLFLGTITDNTIRIRTYITKRQCFPNQKEELSFLQEKTINEIEEEWGKD